MPDRERMKPRDSHLTWNGAPKIGYGSEAEALAKIPEVAPHQRMLEPTAYHCPTCDQWHIGNDSLLPEWPLSLSGATIGLANV